jgi:hypothetical protein
MADAIKQYSWITSNKGKINAKSKYKCHNFASGQVDSSDLAA